MQKTSFYFSCRKWIRKSHVGGFTLIELLVVISIIAVLAALLTPALMNARKSSLATASTSNLHQIHILMQNYLAQNNYVYPNAVYTTNVLAGQGGLWVYWRRMIWEANNPSTGFWDPQFVKSGYKNVMWCPLMKSQYGSCDYNEGHGSYALHQYFNNYGSGRERRSINMQGMGKQVPYIFTGTVQTGQKNIGTYAYSISSAYPYDTTWLNLAYEYGAKSDKALGLFLDGSIQMIDKTNGVLMNSMFHDDSNLP